MSALNEPNQTYCPGRRQFINTVITAVGSAAVVASPVVLFAAPYQQTAEALTVQQIIYLILKSVPGAPFAKSVDTIKCGNPAQRVTGIVTTMFATADVIEKAGKLGANFIIAHEPTFYNHADDTQWLENDKVYQYKNNLLKKYNIVVWRFHDYIHSHKPDGVLTGVLNALGWEKYYDAANPRMVKIPAMALQKVVDLSKKKLGIPRVKVIGDMLQNCSRILLIPGAAGGKTQIEALQKEKPDLLIVGELNEWETSEYVRDLRRSGSKTSLLVLGHIVSEEPGLEWLQKWLQPQIPDIKITHIPTTDAFVWA
ncbi:MAG TPA: Nif3-like dinuclear metal center hexameric protein [Segetibacter sp.]|jgi:putative NIF3 family GTP cyclohydrolase 1 type 2